MADDEGWRLWRVVPRMAGRAMGVPVVIGFVVLGAAVVVARSVRDVTREAWGWLPLRRAVSAAPGDAHGSDRDVRAA